MYHNSLQRPHNYVIIHYGTLHLNAEAEWNMRSNDAFMHTIAETYKRNKIRGKETFDGSAISQLDSQVYWIFITNFRDEKIRERLRAIPRFVRGVQSAILFKLIPTVRPGTPITGWTAYNGDCGKRIVRSISAKH